jgi:hypothetical protein
MKRVFLTCGAVQMEFFNRTILRRGDIELRSDPDLDVSFGEIVKSPPDLFIIRDTLGTPLEENLKSFAVKHPDVLFSAAILSGNSYWPGLPFFVKRIMPVNIEPPAFNSIVAELLNLPTRKSARLSIRIVLNLSQQGENIEAGTVNVSGSGMLIESDKPLSPGMIYQIQFTEPPEAAKLPPVLAKVIRRKTGGEPSPASTVYAVEFVALSVSEMEALLKKIIS